MILFPANIRFYILSTSAQLLVNRATAIFNEDILNIPYFDGDNTVSVTERILIKDSLQFHKNFLEEKIFQKPLLIDITDFSNIFCKTLNSIYHISNKQFQAYKILDTDNYYAIHFEYSDESITLTEEQILDLEQYIQEAIPKRNANQQHIHIQKIMKVYGKDSIILIKPKQLRYWLPSIALRDADEVFADYVKARYQDA